MCIKRFEIFARHFECWKGWKRLIVTFGSINRFPFISYFVLLFKNYILITFFNNYIISSCDWVASRESGRRERWNFSSVIIVIFKEMMHKLLLFVDKWYCLSYCYSALCSTSAFVFVIFEMDKKPNTESYYLEKNSELKIWIIYIYIVIFYLARLGSKLSSIYYSGTYSNFLIMLEST